MAQIISENEDAMNDEINVSQEFITRNRELKQKTNKKNGGPYSKEDRIKRQNEVHKLHFEYGYTARKIAELMKVNRNTINGDLNYWYGQILKNSEAYIPEYAVILNLERLNIQRSRIREKLDNAKTFQEMLAGERLIYEIDSKILATHKKLIDSKIRINDMTVDKLNQWLKDNKKTERYMTLLDKISVSDKAYEKISKVITEDRTRNRF